MRRAARLPPRFFLGLSLVCVICALPVAVPAASAPSSESARRSYERGVTLFREGNADGAIEALKKANVIPTFAEHAKIVLSGEIKKAYSVKGIGATKGAREAITSVGGSIAVTSPAFNCGR